MKMEHGFELIATTALGVVLFSAPVVHAGTEPCDDGRSIVIRRTIPYPQAIEREPLTTDRVNTSSTRYIDARRGLRPYDSVHGQCVGQGHALYVGYDDHFGITRPEDRPYTYNHRTPATGVTHYTNASAHPSPPTAASVAPSAAVPIVVIVRDERQVAGPDVAEQAPAPDMTIRIHKDEPVLPSRSGAVIISADGTVIQVGD